MNPILIVVLSIVALLVLFIAVLVIRTLAFKPKNNVKISTEEITFDKKKAVDNLIELVKCKTVSNYDASLEDDKEFRKLISKLPTLYPNIYAKCELIEIYDGGDGKVSENAKEYFPESKNGRALLFRLKGKNSDKPSVFMAHYDVVPVNESEWTKPAFEGLVENGAVWGRGTLDTKVTFNGALFATDHLLGQGFVPEQDIYLAFSGGEEIMGIGAVNIVKYFEKNGITPNLVVDEGGAVVEKMFPGVKEPCGLIGIAEKGMMDIQYTVKSQGGHASAPRPNSPIVELSKACLKVENNPFKFHMTKPVAEMFDTLGRRSNFVMKMIFANMWCFRGILDKICKKSGGEMNALVRTTVAFTQTEGSKASNVIPPVASMVSNIRLNPEDTIDSGIEYLRKTIDNDRVDIKAIRGMNPSPISRTDCDSWDKVASAVASTWKGCVVAPYLMVQCSDSRHYGKISDKVYRFSAMDLTPEERASIHGNNEHIRIETIEHAVEFYIRLIKQC